MINVYSDATQTALKYLKNTEANIHNVLVMVLTLGIVVGIFHLIFNL